MLAKEAIDFRTNTGEFMKKVLLVVTSLLAFLSVTQGASAQSEIRRFEIGGQFSRINFDSSPISLSLQERTEPGFGGRFTYNIKSGVGP